jgi:Trk K+ transport system NAD-binding subunit
LAYILIDPDRLEHDLSEGRRVVYGDAQDISMWENLDMAHLKSVVIALSTNFDLKLHVIQILNKCEVKFDIYALAINEKEEQMLSQVGAEPVLIPALQIGQKMGERASMNKD